MGKSYGKYVTIGMCYGSNTEYYRQRNRFLRRKNRHLLNLAKSLIDIEEYFPVKLPKEDQWDEPTDGHWKVFANEIRKRYSKYYRLNKNNKVKR